MAPRRASVPAGGPGGRGGGGGPAGGRARGEGGPAGGGGGPGGGGVRRRRARTRTRGWAEPRAGAPTASFALRCTENVRAELFPDADALPVSSKVSAVARRGWNRAA